MLEPTEQAIVDKSWPTLWVISASMFGALVVYGVLCYVLAGMPFIPAYSAQVEVIRYIFIFLSAGALVFAYFLRKTMLSGRSPKSSVAPREAPSFFARYMMAVIVSDAISEAVAIFGLILLFLGDGLTTVYVFIAVSALAMLIFRPHRDELEQFADRIRVQ